MPDSVLNSDRLADALVGVVDEVRSLIHAELGTRPNRVFLVRRVWSGAIAGDGSPTDTEVEILPPPRVTDLALRATLRPAGREEEGDVLLTEVSLRYAEAELYPTGLPKNVEAAYRIDEAHGQARASRWLVPASNPVARRGDHAGDQSDWAITLKAVEPWR
jgi:hypothetical protein